MATMIRVSFIDSLDQWEVRMIMEFLSLYDTLLMRASCSHVRDCAASISLGNGTKNKRTPGWLLIKSAGRKHRELCELAREWGATRFNEMLYSAAKGGHRDLCILAREWGATGFYFMLECAARCGHRDICKLAREWGAPNFDDMLECAVRYGHRDIYKLAREWSAGADEDIIDDEPDDETED